MVTSNKFQEYVQRLDEARGMIGVRIEELVRQYGREKAGAIIVKEIAANLQSLEIKHLPDELPNSSNEWVILYKEGSAAGDLITAILHPSEKSGDLIYTALQPEANNKLERIKDILKEEVI